MKNFNLERFIRELEEKGWLNEKEANFFIDNFRGFTFKPDMGEKRNFFQTMEKPTGKELEKKIWEARVKALKSDIKIQIIAQSIWFDAMVERCANEKKEILKRIYLFIIKNTK